ncbi:peptidoglycan bridge formation glycyltransferase FemA/FemB family protein [Streptomyces sp. NPDC050738]|uniref:lipid II:glycine glycyltransferase FemX n=1 Tax=Streptomyces sp. NPDC050738 TaxID=3154744 RepID=UPI003436A9DD
MSLTVRTISTGEHLGHLALYPSASPLQTPAWGRVKQGWDAESVGWFDADGAQREAALVLYRQAPGTRRSLAYVPEGPAVDWFLPHLVEGRLRPLLVHARERGAFAVRMGPPVVVRHWEASTVEAALADPAAGRARRLGEIPADWTDPRAMALTERLRALGWRPVEDGVGQPGFVVRVGLAGREVEELRAGLGAYWRRGIEIADEAGVRVGWGTEADLGDFHALYARDSARGGNTPRPLEYFRRMWEALNADGADGLRLYLAEYEGDVVAASLMTLAGTQVRHAYSGPAVRHRELRPSCALHWRMLCDAHAMGAEFYELGGVTDGLAQGTGPAGAGRLRFKVGSGGRVEELIGEWEFSLGRVLHKALDVYLARR